MNYICVCKNRIEVIQLSADANYVKCLKCGALISVKRYCPVCNLIVAPFDPNKVIKGQDIYHWHCRNTTN